MSSAINLDIAKLEYIKDTISNVDALLISDSLPELKMIISDIRRNVLSDGLKVILSDLEMGIIDVLSDIRKDLLKLEEFIDAQITVYRASTVNALERVEAIVSRMEAIASNIVTKIS